MSNSKVENLRMFHAPGLTEAALAKVLRSGEADQLFLNGIAMLLDPGIKKPLYRLHLQKARAHRPKGATYDENALVEDLRALDCSPLSRGEKKAARMDILNRYGISDRTARLALQEADKFDQIWERMKELKLEGTEDAAKKSDT